MHSLQTEIQGQRTGEVEIRLVCICGSVFARGLFAVDDPRHQQAIKDEGVGEGAGAFERRGAAAV